MCLSFPYGIAIASFIVSILILIEMTRWRFSSALLFFAIMSRIAGKQMWLRKLEVCDKNYDYPIKFESTNIILDGKQIANITAIVTTPLGQDQSMNATFELSSSGDEYMPLFKFSRSNLCDFLNKDIGTFWVELQAQIGIPPRTCPVQNGRYMVRNYELPFKKLNVPLPPGFIRSHIYIVEKKTNRLISCLYVLMEASK